MLLRVQLYNNNCRARLHNISNTSYTYMNMHQLYFPPSGFSYHEKNKAEPTLFLRSLSTNEYPLSCVFFCDTFPFVDQTLYRWTAGDSREPSNSSLTAGQNDVCISTSALHPGQNRKHHYISIPFVNSSLWVFRVLECCVNLVLKTKHTRQY